VDIRARDVSLRYDGTIVVHRVNLVVGPGQTAALVGPNGSGKTTLLRGLARLLPPLTGAVYLDGRDMSRVSRGELARQLGLLPQHYYPPQGLRVRELVACGCYPHLNWWQRLTVNSGPAVERAMDRAGVAHLADRPVATLSGGERQRTYLAMVLAQEARVLLLDEPTTFLDLGHQVALMDTLYSLQQATGLTIVMVLHDLNQACRYADQLIVLSQGKVVAAGCPAEVVTPALGREVFGVDVWVTQDPVTGHTCVIPRNQHPSRNGDP